MPAPAALALCVPEARGPQGRRQEPGAVSARARDLWPHLRLRHPPPVQVRNCAAGVGPRSSPFLEGLCGVRLRCAGRGASSRVCVAWTAPVTPSSSSGSGAPFMRARARRGLLVGQARRRDHHGRTRRRPPAPVVQGCAAASSGSLSASGDSLIKPSGGAGPEGAGRLAGHALQRSGSPPGQAPSAVRQAPAGLAAGGPESRPGL